MSILTWLSLFFIIIFFFFILFLLRAVADGRSSTLLELRRTVTHGDNVNVIRLYLDEWDVMSLNVDKAEPLLPKGRPLWVQCDLIFKKKKNGTIHASWGTNPPRVQIPDVWLFMLWNEWLKHSKTKRINCHLCYDNLLFIFKLMMWIGRRGCKSIFQGIFLKSCKFA